MFLFVRATCGRFISIGLLAALVFGFAHASRAQYEPRPIPSGERVATQKQTLEHTLRFVMRQVDDYRKLTKDPMELRDQVAAYITDVQRHQWTNSHKKTWEELRKEGEALLAAGAQDPVLLLNLGEVYFRNSEMLLERKTMKLAVDGFEEMDYPPQWKLRAAAELKSLCRIWQRGDELTKYSGIARSSVVAFLTQYQPKDQDMRVAFAWIRPVISASVLQRVDNNDRQIETIKNNGEEFANVDDLDPWLRAMILGDTYEKLAWQNRGNKWAGDVKQKGWDGFNEYLSKAAGKYVEAYRLRPTFPEAAGAMVAVAGAADDKLKMREWFDQAVATQLDYMPAYESMVHYSMPRWSGSLEQMFDFGKECLATQRYDTLVPWMLHRCVEEMRMDHPGGLGGAFTDPLLYPHLRLLYMQMLANPWPDDGPRRSLTDAQIKTHLLLLTTQGTVTADAKEAIEKFGRDLDVKLMQSLGVRWEAAKSHIYLQESLLADSWNEFGAKFIQGRPDVMGDPATAVKTLTSLINRCEDARAKPIMETWRRSFENEVRFQQGEWVDLTFDSPLLWHQTARCDWTVESPTSIVAHGSILNRDQMMLMSTGYFPGPIEVMMDVEQLTAEQMTMQLGFLLFDSNQIRFDTPGVHFWSDPIKNKIGVTGHGSSAVTRTFEKPRPVTSHLHAFVWHDHQEFFVNGDAAPSLYGRRYGLKGAFSIGWGNWFYSSGRARFSNIRIRKISDPSPKKGKEAQAFFARLVEEHPEYQDAHALWARSRVEVAKNAEQRNQAIAILEKAEQMGSTHPKIPTVYSRIYKALHDDQAVAKQLARHVTDEQDELDMRLSLVNLLLTTKDESLHDVQRAHDVAAAINKKTKEKYSSTLAALAKTEALLGDFDKALMHVEKAIKLAPNANLKKQYENQLKAYTDEKENSDKKPAAKKKKKKK